MAKPRGADRPDLPANLRRRSAGEPELLSASDVEGGRAEAWEAVLGIVWTIVVGFIAGIIAKFIMPGPNEPSGFVLTTILGIIGAFVATYLGQSLGWYAPGQGAGLIGAIVGAIVVLLVWGMISGRDRSV